MHVDVRVWIGNPWTPNFPIQYPYIIQQTGNKNLQTYQVEVITKNDKE